MNSSPGVYLRPGGVEDVDDPVRRGDDFDFLRRRAMARDLRPSFLRRGYRDGDGKVSASEDAVFTGGHGPSGAVAIRPDMVGADPGAPELRGRHEG